MKKLLFFAFLSFQFVLFSQTIPPTNGDDPGLSTAPPGWSFVSGSPDIADADGPDPGGGMPFVCDVDLPPNGHEDWIQGVAGGVTEQSEATITGLTPGETYTFCYYAGNFHGEGGFWGGASVTKNETVNLTIDGVISSSVIFTGDSCYWQEGSCTFTAAGTTAILSQSAVPTDNVYSWWHLSITEDAFDACEDPCAALTTTVSATDICVGETVTLEASSETGGTVTWDGGVVDGIAFEPPVGTTTYTATSDSDLDCDFSVDITVHELPDVTATASDDVICLGEEVSVSGGGATDYTWDPAVDDGVAFTPADAGTTTYTVTGTDDFGCSNTATVDVTVAPAPDAAIEFVVAGLSSEDGGTGGCIASEVQFNDISTIADPETIVSWDWDFGDGDGSSDENPTHLYDAPGTYTVTLTVTSENGCTATIDIEIVMTEGLSLELIFNNPTCFGFNDGSVTVNVLGGVGELIFTITDEDGNVLNEDNSNTANSLPEGWYYITVDDDSECSGDVSVFLDDPDEMEVDITVVDPACYGEASGWARVDEVFNATGDEDGLSFFWAPNTFGDEGLGVDSAWALTAGDYTLTVNDENGCSKVIDFNVSQPDSLFLSEFGFEPAHCRLFGYQSGNGVVFGAAGGGTADYDYTWRDLTTDDTYPNTTWGGLNPGDYELTVTDENGCTLIRTITLDSISPIANFNVISDELNADLQGTAPVTAVFENTSTNFHNEFDPFSDTTFFWSLNHPDAGWDVTDSYFYQPDTVYGPKGQSYTVDVCLIAFNKNGCADTLCKELTIYEAFDIVDINIFTPNGDGANDIFTFEFQAASIAEFECVIVNRWGVVMAELNDITDGWDGNDLGGSPAADGTYFYVYKATTDNSTKLEGQGTIQLVRGQ